MEIIQYQDDEGRDMLAFTVGYNKKELDCAITALKTKLKKLLEQEQDRTMDDLLEMATKRLSPVAEAVGKVQMDTFLRSLGLSAEAVHQVASNEDAEPDPEDIDIAETVLHELLDDVKKLNQKDSEIEKLQTVFEFMNQEIKHRKKEKEDDNA